MVRPDHRRVSAPASGCRRNRHGFPVERNGHTAFHRLVDTARSAARRTAWSALTILVAGAVLAGCSDKRSDADGSTTTVKTTSTTTTEPSSTTTDGPTTTTVAADPVLTAYLAFWDMYIELAGMPPPFNPDAVKGRLGELTTGAEKAQLFDFLQKNAATGLVLRGDIEHSPTVTSNDGTVAVVRDCMDDRTGIYRTTDNSRVDTDDPARHLYTVTLRQDGGVWRVETVKTGPEPCTA